MLEDYDHGYQRDCHHHGSGQDWTPSYLVLATELGDNDRRGFQVITDGILSFISPCRSVAGDPSKSATMTSHLFREGQTGTLFPRQSSLTLRWQPLESASRSKRRVFRLREHLCGRWLGRKRLIRFHRGRDQVG